MDDKTIDAYNRLAQKYDEDTVDFWEKFPKTFLESFSALALGSVLDVGSGPGRDGLLLKDRGLNVTCLDASTTMIDLCRAKGLEGIVGDFHHLPFSNSSFDAVWAYTSLLHVPRSEVTIPLREIHRVLKPEGVFGLGLIEGEGEVYKENEKVPLPRLFCYYQKQEIESLLHETGFEIVSFESFKPGKHTYLNFIARKR